MNEPPTNVPMTLPISADTPSKPTWAADPVSA
jgi:hypothetical protein